MNERMQGNRRLRKYVSFTGFFRMSLS